MLVLSALGALSDIRAAAAAFDGLDPSPADAVSWFEEDVGKFRLELYVGGEADAASACAVIGHAAPSLHVISAPVKDADWIAMSLDGLPAVRAGRFVVAGSHALARTHAGVRIWIEASQAFGTGHHGTTRGCLLALDALLKRRRRARVLDVGTGTGVLAIAAAKILHGAILTTDIDPVAVRVANANARHNGVAAFITNRVADGRRSLPWRGPFDIILANILLGPLTRMAPQLARRLAPGGAIILSGLLPEQANAAIAAYRAQGLALVRRSVLENWATLVMKRRSK